MKFFKRYLRISIYPDYNKLQEKYTQQRIREMYPPVIINKYPDEFSANCSIIRSATAVSQLTLDVVNLSAYIRLHILNSQYRKISVEVGYLGNNWRLGDKIDDSNMEILFKGTLVWMGTTVEARKNITTRFVGVSGEAEYVNSTVDGFMNISYEAGYNIYQLVREVCVNSYNPDVRLNLSEAEKNKLIGVVTNAKQASDLGGILRKFSVDAVYDWEGTSAHSTDDWINLSSSTIATTIYEVNEKTGLIDIPSLQDDRKIKFKMLVNPKIKILDYVRLNNYDIQLLNVDDGSSTDSLKKANSGSYLDKEGIYRINRISYSLESRGSNFTMDVEAIARDIYATVTGEANK